MLGLSAALAAVILDSDGGRGILIGEVGWDGRMSLGEAVREALEGDGGREVFDGEGARGVLDGDGARGARGVFDSEAEREAGGCGLVGPALIDAGRRGVTMTWLGFGLGSGEA